MIALVNVSHAGPRLKVANPTKHAGAHIHAGYSGRRCSINNGSYQQPFGTVFHAEDLAKGYVVRHDVMRHLAGMTPFPQLSLVGGATSAQHPVSQVFLRLRHAGIPPHCPESLS